MLLRTELCTDDTWLVLQVRLIDLASIVCNMFKQTRLQNIISSSLNFIDKSFLSFLHSIYLYINCTITYITIIHFYSRKSLARMNISNLCTRVLHSTNEITRLKRRDFIVSNYTSNLKTFRSPIILRTIVSN